MASTWFARRAPRWFWMVQRGRPHPAPAAERAQAAGAALPLSPALSGPVPSVGTPPPPALGAHPGTAREPARPRAAAARPGPSGRCLPRTRTEPRSAEPPIPGRAPTPRVPRWQRRIRAPSSGCSRRASRGRSPPASRRAHQLGLVPALLFRGAPAALRVHPAGAQRLLAARARSRVSVHGSAGLPPPGRAEPSRAERSRPHRSHGPPAPAPPGAAPLLPRPRRARARPARATAPERAARACALRQRAANGGAVRGARNAPGAGQGPAPSRPGVTARGAGRGRRCPSCRGRDSAAGTGVCSARPTWPWARPAIQGRP